MIPPSDRCKTTSVQQAVATLARKSLNDPTLISSAYHSRAEARSSACPFQDRRRLRRGHDYLLPIWSNCLRSRRGRLVFLERRASRGRICMGGRSDATPLRMNSVSSSCRSRSEEIHAWPALTSATNLWHPGCSGLMMLIRGIHCSGSADRYA